MKGKKLILAGSIFGAVLFGSGVSSAATIYYIDYMDRMNTQVTQSIDTNYSKQFKEMDSRLYQQTISAAYDEMNQVQKDGNTYLNQKLSQYEQNKMNTNTVAIKARGQQLETELKKHIDSLFPPEK